MSSKKSFQIKLKQKAKRRSNRQRLIKAGLDPKNCYYSGYYIKEKP